MNPDPTTPLAPSLGVIVPCRNEAAVIERKIKNLARLRWPVSAQPHRIVIVDDGSSDATVERSRALLRESFGSRTDAAPLRVVATVVGNAQRAGKPGAIRQGIQELGTHVELFAVSDADVILEPHALECVARAFADEPELAMASLAQRFVADLAADGSCRRASGDEDPIDAMYAFDRWTACVRRFESRHGLLFSVHGQFLVWRASLGLAPRLGLAADDIDLMLQVRARAGAPRRVRLLRDASFLEVKTSEPEAAREQALRRARAYVQVVRSSDVTPRTLGERVQWLFYRHAPLAAPMLTVVLPLAAIGACFAAGRPWVGLASVAALMVAALTSPVRRWCALMRVIHAATRLEARGTLPERWEMARR